MAFISSGSDVVFLMSGTIAATAALKVRLWSRLHWIGRRIVVIGRAGMSGVMIMWRILALLVIVILVLMLHRVHMMVISLVHWWWRCPKMLLTRIMVAVVRWDYVVPCHNWVVVSVRVVGRLRVIV